MIIHLWRPVTVRYLSNKVLQKSLTTTGTLFRYGTIRYHPWTSFPDLRNQETLPGSASLPVPYFFTFLFRSHTIFPIQRMHKGYPFYGNAGITDRLFSRPTPHLYNAETACQGNKVRIYVPYLMLWKTT